MSFDAISVWESLTARLRGIGQLLPPLILRLIMGWEFWESGWEKYTEKILAQILLGLE